MLEQPFAPIHFVSSGQPIWPEALDGTAACVDEATIHARMHDSFNSWVMQTMIRLAHAGIASTISAAPKPGAVNIGVLPHFAFRLVASDAFLAICRADSYDTPYADFVIEQNGLRPASPRRASVPHWPQPNLTPRDAARGDRIETIVYKGRASNLDARFRSDAIRAAFAARGTVLRVEDKPADGTPPPWADYGSADLTLAARNMTAADAQGKPATKLINAWMAGTPALLGPEPAFLELRQDDRDFFVIRTADDALAAVDRLRAEPGLYAAMVAHGRRRAEAYTPEKITGRWIEVINGPLQEAYRRWAREPHALRLARLPLRYLAYKRARARYRHNIHNGPRILDA